MLCPSRPNPPFPASAPHSFVAAERLEIDNAVQTASQMAGDQDHTRNRTGIEMIKKLRLWTKRLGITLLVVIGAVLLAQVYYRLPDISGRPQTFAIDDGMTTSIGRRNAPQLAAHPGKAGVYLLSDGRDAFAARALLARLAEKTLDVQYYMYHQDTVGGLLSYELLRAADRGVRVRLLIDDIYGNENEETWVALDAHPNIEVRFWNPWKRGSNRMIQSILRVSDINYRMHAKSFTADNQATILGGRNIGDEYFDADTEVAFSDIDVLAIGPPVAEVSTEFDNYWNSEFAYPSSILVREGTDQDVAALRSAQAAFYEKQATSKYVVALTESNLAHGLADGSLEFSWADTRVISDSPEKKELGKAGKDELLISQLAPYITGAKKSAYIVSPYFVPGDRATDALRQLAGDGVKVSVLTNSLASNDVSAVHAGYSKYRRKLLRGGVRLFELDESLKEVKGESFTWLPGLKKSSLHAKTMVFDGETLFVGSFNFDQRSLFINNEIGLLIHDPVLAGAAAKHFEEDVGKVAFEVKFASDGGRHNMEWVGGVGGPDVVMGKEPYATTTQKALVGILKWLPIDSQL
jgi:putative cardiolipin synthase